MPLIPNTKRTRIPILPPKEFRTILELPEEAVFDLDNHTFKYRMNQSRLQMYNDCPRRFYWKQVANLDIDFPILKLELGSGVHEGLAWLGAGSDMKQAIEKSKQRFLQEYTGRALMPDQQAELDAACATIERMLPAYVDEWERTPWTPLGQEIGGEVEVGKVSVGGHVWTVSIVFRLDKLVTWNHQIWLVDHKTAAKLDLRDVAKYAMDVQMTAYTYAGTKLLEAQGVPGITNPRIQGVVVDMLVKTQIPQFHREAFMRTDEDLVEFQYDWLGWSEEIIRRRERAKTFEAVGIPGKLAFSKNTKNCYLFGNCPYLDICPAGKDTPQSRLAYVQRRKDYVDDEALMRKEAKGV